MKNKIQRHQRRKRNTRAKIAQLAVNRLCVHRTPRHIYAQIIDVTGGKVLTSASTVEAEVRSQLKNGGNKDAAEVVGKRIAQKAKAAGIDRVAFDRSGFAFHGRIKALADAARKNGLQF